MSQKATFVDRVIAINNFWKLPDKPRALKFSAELGGACLFGTLNSVIIVLPWAIPVLLVLSAAVTTMYPLPN